MIEPGSVDFVAQRHAPFIYTALFKGVDLTAADFWLQVRLVGDAPGSALLSLVNAPAGSQGVSAALSGSDTVVTIRITQLALEALPLDTANPDTALCFDLQIQPLAGDREVYLYGAFIVEAGVTFIAPPTPHRYWRLSVPHSDDGDFFVDATEIELRIVPGGADVTGGGCTYTASDELAFSGIVANAFDNSTGTLWSTNVSPTFPVTVKVDFGAGNEKAIVEVSWLPRSDAPARSPAALDVQWSDNGTVWNTLWSVASIAGWAAGVAKVFTKP